MIVIYNKNNDKYRYDINTYNDYDVHIKAVLS